MNVFKPQKSKQELTERLKSLKTPRRIAVRLPCFSVTIQTVWEEGTSVSIKNIDLSTIYFIDDKYHDMFFELFGMKNLRKLQEFGEDDVEHHFLMKYLTNRISNTAEIKALNHEIKALNHEIKYFCEIETTKKDWDDYLHHVCGDVAEKYNI